MRILCNIECLDILFISFGAKHHTPRSLSARNLGNLVCVEGIVTKCKSVFFRSSIIDRIIPGSLVSPKVVKSVHYCPATKKTIERKYSDLTSLNPFPTSGAYPTKVSGCGLMGRGGCLHDYRYPNCRSGAILFTVVIGLRCQVITICTL